MPKGAFYEHDPYGTRGGGHPRQPFQPLGEELEDGVVAHAVPPHKQRAPVAPEHGPAGQPVYAQHLEKGMGGLGGQQHFQQHAGYPPQPSLAQQPPHASQQHPPVTPLAHHQPHPAALHHLATAHSSPHASMHHLPHPQPPQRQQQPHMLPQPGVVHPSALLQQQQQTRVPLPAQPSPMQQQQQQQQPQPQRPQLQVSMSFGAPSPLPSPQMSLDAPRSVQLLQTQQQQQQQLSPQQQALSLQSKPQQKIPQPKIKLPQRGGGDDGACRANGKRKNAREDGNGGGGRKGRGREQQQSQQQSAKEKNGKRAPSASPERKEKASRGPERKAENDHGGKGKAEALNEQLLQHLQQLQKQVKELQEAASATATATSPLSAASLPQLRASQENPPQQPQQPRQPDVALPAHATLLQQQQLQLQKQQDVLQAQLQALHDALAASQAASLQPSTDALQNLQMQMQRPQPQPPQQLSASLQQHPDAAAQHHQQLLLFQQQQHQALVAAAAACGQLPHAAAQPDMADALRRVQEIAAEAAAQHEKAQAQAQRKASDKKAGAQPTIRIPVPKTSQRAADVACRQNQRERERAGRQAQQQRTRSRSRSKSRSRKARRGRGEQVAVPALPLPAAVSPPPTPPGGFLDAAPPPPPPSDDVSSGAGDRLRVRVPLPRAPSPPPQTPPQRAAEAAAKPSDDRLGSLPQSHVSHTSRESERGSHSVASPSQAPSYSVDAECDTDYSLVSSHSSQMTESVYSVRSRTSGVLNGSGFLSTATSAALSPNLTNAGAPGMDTSDVEVLETLGLLRDSGVISHNEFRYARNKLLGRVFRSIPVEPDFERIPLSGAAKAKHLDPALAGSNTGRRSGTASPGKRAAVAGTPRYVIRNIPASRLTAGSCRDGRTPGDASMLSPTGWEPDFSVPDGNWVCMDLQTPQTIWGVALVNGSPDAAPATDAAATAAASYVTSVKFSHSKAGRVWKTIDRDAVFEGCSEAEPSRNIMFHRPLKTRYLRVHPKTWVGRASLRCGVVVPVADSSSEGHAGNSSSNEGEQQPAGRPADDALAEAGELDGLRDMLMKFFATHHPGKLHQVNTLLEHRQLLRLDRDALHKRLEGLGAQPGVPMQPAPHVGGGGKTNLLIINKRTNQTMKLRACVASLTSDRLKWFVAQQWGLPEEGMVVSSRSGVNVDANLKVFQDEIRQQRVIFCEPLMRETTSDSDSGVSM